MTHVVVDGVKIIWTQHAIKRVNDRFSNPALDTFIPYTAIAAICANGKNKRYEVRTKYAVFVCRRKTRRAVAIITVIHTDKAAEITKRSKRLL